MRVISGGVGRAKRGLPSGIGEIKLRQPFVDFEGCLGIDKRILPKLLLCLEGRNLIKGIRQIALPDGVAGVARRQFVPNRQTVAVALADNLYKTLAGINLCAQPLPQFAVAGGKVVLRDRIKAQRAYGDGDGLADGVQLGANGGKKKAWPVYGSPVRRIEIRPRSLLNTHRHLRKLYRRHYLWR